MSLASPTRHYPIEISDFADFWDLCGHFLKMHPQCSEVVYSVMGVQDPIAENERDVSTVLKQLHLADEEVKFFKAKLISRTMSTSELTENPEIMYFPKHADDMHQGLTFCSESLSKLSLYEFENVLFEKYGIHDDGLPIIEFGKPCEILAAIIDLRGFSSFCEKPNIESPYTCGLMYSFYQLVSKSFYKYPPELIKYLGDGVLAVWETNFEDRQVAIDICLEGVNEMNSKWKVVRRSPQFSHGAPEEVAIGISFGLASQLPGTDDYIGRPINIASRLCSVCPGGDIFIDKSVPSISPQFPKEDTSVHIRSFGRYYIWRVRGD